MARLRSSAREFAQLPADSSEKVAPRRARTRQPRMIRRVLLGLLACLVVLAAAYSGISVYVMSQLAYAPRMPLTTTPASRGVAYTDVAFPARTDHLHLRGWFIPGILPDGRLTDRRTLILVHGTRANRADPGAGELDLSAALAHHGFAVLAFDMRGMGQSAPAPLTLGYFEQRDVLGAVDFLRSDTLPYPQLGRPRAIGGWGVSMGAATLLLAAAKEPAIAAVVSDSAYSALVPLLQRELPKYGHLPAFFTPGVVTAARLLYGVNPAGVRPVAVVASIAPRPLLFIHGAADSLIPPSNMRLLVQAARSAPDAHVQSWLVPGADHAQAYHVAGATYVQRVVSFFDDALGPAS